MGCGPRSRYRRRHAEAWTYVLAELDPDVLLVQEALLSSIESARCDAVALCTLADGVDAGTAVLVRGTSAAPVEVQAIGASTYFACARLDAVAGPLVVGSVHVYPGHRHAQDLAELTRVASSLSDDAAVLIGGDFNAARRFDEVYGGTKHRSFFEGMGARGLRDVHFALHGREVQTFWGHQAKEKYQDDHFFLSESWAARVRSCQVVDNETVRELSDHAAVVLELRINAE